jgi:hypothetical protein
MRTANPFCLRQVFPELEILRKVPIDEVTVRQLLSGFKTRFDNSLNGKEAESRRFVKDWDFRTLVGRYRGVKPPGECGCFHVHSTGLLILYGFFTMLRLAYATEFGGITDNVETFKIAQIGQACFVYFLLELLVEFYSFRHQLCLTPFPHIILSCVVLAGDFMLLCNMLDVSEENEMMVLAVRLVILFKMVCGVGGKPTPPYLLAKNNAWCTKGVQVPQKRLMKEGNTRKRGGPKKKATRAFLERGQHTQEMAVEDEGRKAAGGGLIQVGPTNQPSGEASFLMQALRHELGHSSHMLSPPVRSRWVCVRAVGYVLFHAHRFCRDGMEMIYDRGVELHFTRGEVEEPDEDADTDMTAQVGGTTRKGCRPRVVLVLEKLLMVLLILLIWFFGLVSVQYNTHYTHSTPY